MRTRCMCKCGQPPGLGQPRLFFRRALLKCSEFPGDLVPACHADPLGSIVTRTGRGRKVPVLVLARPGAPSTAWPPLQPGRRRHGADETAGRSGACSRAHVPHSGCALDGGCGFVRGLQTRGGGGGAVHGEARKELDVLRHQLVARVECVVLPSVVDSRASRWCCHHPPFRFKSY